MGATLAGLLSKRRIGCVALLLAGLWGYAAAVRGLGRLVDGIDAGEGGGA